MRKLLVAVAVLTLIPQMALAGGGGGDVSQCPGFAHGTSISMLDSCFSGVAHIAPADTTITISNDGQLPHSYTAVDGSFDSGQLQPGETFQLTVDEPRVVEVFCTLHGSAQGAGMSGVLLVGDAEPGPVASSMDIAAIREAVAGESQVFADALENQGKAISDLGAAQEALVVGLEEQAAATGIGSTETPVIVTVPAESGAVLTQIAVGLATGLALAALMTALRLRRAADQPTTGLGRLKPSVES